MDQVDGTITTEARGPLWMMGINRPAKLNGFTPEMFEQLAAAYTALETRDDLLVGILFAHGTHFTAGLDLPRFAERMASNAEVSPVSGVDPFGLRPPVRTKPIIAACRGITYTAGLEMALAADVIIAASDCRFAMVEPKRGLMPTGGATVRFVERGGWGNAMRWLLTGDEFGAEEALRIGIAQEIVPPDTVLARAIELGTSIAERAPLAVRAIRANALLYATQGEAAAMAAFGPTQQQLAKSADFAEGVRSFIEKRAARFSGV